MTKGIFITATGTDVGKTYVCGLIVKKVREYGINCGYYKPVLSGLECAGSRLIPGDCKYVLQTSGLNNIDPMECVSYAFEPAVSPHLASRMANNPISIDKIIEDFNNKKDLYDYIVVEGAGGITCPFRIEENETILLPDIIKALNLDLLIVAPSGLGSINYTLLTCEYAKQTGIKIQGIILNKYDKDNFMHIDNKESVERLCHVPVIATIKEGETDIQIDESTLISAFKEI